MKRTPLKPRTKPLARSTKALVRLGIKSFERRWFTSDGVLTDYAQNVYPKQVARRLELGWVA